MERLIAILKFICELGQAWMRFGVLLFCLVLVLPLAYAAFLILTMLPFYFFSYMANSSKKDFPFLLLVLVIAAVIVLLELFGSRFSIIRGRQIRSEEDAIRKTKSGNRPASMIRRKNW